jgi:hypothetical protein
MKDKRFELMEEGLHDLEQLLLDIIRQGIAQVKDRSLSYWEERAARLVDAKLPSLARRLRKIPLLISSDSDWPEAFLEEVGQLFLLVKGFRNRELLTAPLHADLLSGLGVYQKKEDVLSNSSLAVKDQWQVLGMLEGMEEKLRFRRSWLYGKNSNRFALILDFVFGNQPFSDSLETGKSYEAEVCYYSGAYPLRGLLKDGKPLANPKQPVFEGYSSINHLQDAYSRVLAANPWVYLFPGDIIRGSSRRRGRQYFPGRQRQQAY